MSRTYRRQDKSKNRRGSTYGRSHKRAVSVGYELPSFYRNATRTYCAAASAEKWLFHSKGAAIEAAKYNFSNKIREGKQGIYERSYYCKACGGFHLTRMNVEQWRNRKSEIAHYNGMELDEKGNFTKPRSFDKQNRYTIPDDEITKKN